MPDNYNDTLEKTIFRKSNPHHGRNIRLFRITRKIDVSELARKLNTDQSTVSKFEESEILDDKTINEIAKVLDISPEYIKEFPSDDLVKNYIGNISGENNTNIVGNESVSYYNYPIEKITEIYESRIQKLEEKNNDLQLKLDNALVENEQLKKRLSK